MIDEMVRRAADQWRGFQLSRAMNKAKSAEQASAIATEWMARNG